MKKTQTTTQPAADILPMTELKGMDAGALTNLFVASSKSSRVAYLTAAKSLIALAACVGIKSAKTRLLKAGATESDIRNGQQLALVWDEFVEAGHITEAQFNELRYLDAVNLRRAARERGMEVAVANAGDLDEIAHIAEHGTTRAEAKANKERAAATKAAAPAAAPSATATATASTAPTEAVPPSNVVPGPGSTPPPAEVESEKDKGKGRKGNKVDEFRRLAEAAEAVGMDVITSGAPEADVQAIIERVTMLAKTLTEAAASVSETPASKVA